jgi:hypothetical protein
MVLDAVMDPDDWVNGDNVAELTSMDAAFSLVHLDVLFTQAPLPMTYTFGSRPSLRKSKPHS